MGHASCASQISFELTVLRKEDAILAQQEFLQDVVKGLSQPAKTLSSKYFYDDRGSELYTKITDLDEYYLTRTESFIFEQYAADIATQLADASRSEPLNVVELGAGDGRKTKLLLQALLDHQVNFEYLPVDISRHAMSDMFEALRVNFTNADLTVHGVVGDYIDCLEHIVTAHPTRTTAVMFIGSSIGNFSSMHGVDFLKQIREKLNLGDMLLLGCDLVKDCEIMRKAYFDSKGVTSAFNLNLLSRMNKELGTDFCEGDFEHLAIFNPRSSGMESYLLAKRDLKVTMKIPASLLGTPYVEHDTYQFNFRQAEAIHMEVSQKYTASSVKNLLCDAGYKITAYYFDKRKWFLDALATVPRV